MSINKPLFYTGMAAAAIALSTSGVVCAKIESTKAKLDAASKALDESEKKAAVEISKSSNQASKNAEKARCDTKKDSCDKKIRTKVGPTVESVTKTIVDQCDHIYPYTYKGYETCNKVTSRVVIGGLLPLASDYTECAEEAAECYSKIEKN